MDNTVAASRRFEQLVFSLLQHAVGDPQELDLEPHGLGDARPRFGAVLRTGVGEAVGSTAVEVKYFSSAQKASARLADTALKLAGPAVAMGLSNLLLVHNLPGVATSDGRFTSVRTQIAPLRLVVWGRDQLRRLAEAQQPGSLSKGDSLVLTSLKRSVNHAADPTSGNESLLQDLQAKYAQTGSLSF